MEEREVGKRGGQMQRVRKFCWFAAHRFAAVQKDADGDALFGAIGFEEELPEPKVSAPIEGTGIVTCTVTAVARELEARSNIAGAVIGAHHAGEIVTAEKSDLFECS